MRRRPTQRAAEGVPHGRARLRLRCLLISLLCALIPACKPNKRYDLIEAELRTRERELSETRAALEQARNLNRAYAEQSSHSSGPVVPNPAAPLYVPVRDISLARGTGGIDEDGAPGDEGLMLVILPRDEDGAAVKVPAKVQIAAWEVTPAGIKNPIGNWDVPAEKVRPTWRQGFVSTGYFVAVPWQTYPSSEKVRIAVRLTTLDGRCFETDKDVFVKLCSSPRPADTPTTPVPRPAREPLFPDPVPPGTEELPLPTPANERGVRLSPPGKP